MTNPKPVVVALPLDHQTDELLATALDLGQRLECPFVVVHALGKRRMESESEYRQPYRKGKADPWSAAATALERGAGCSGGGGGWCSRRTRDQHGPTHQRSAHYHGRRPAGDHPAMACGFNGRGHRPPRSCPRLGRAGGADRQTACALPAQP